MEHKDCCGSKGGGSKDGHTVHRQHQGAGNSASDYSEGSGKGFSFSKSKLLGAVILIVLAAGLIATIRWAGSGTSPASVSGVSKASGNALLASPPSDASGHSMDGFNSYEEMMAAHHPESASSKASGAAPASSAPAPSGQGPYQGYNSYEEMMAAHHPAGGGGHGGAQGGESGMDNPGCGGVSEASTETSSYGLMYNNAGYTQLLEDAKTLSATPEQEKLFVGLDVQLPCCGVKALQAKGNCECGHHIALFGLAKKLAIAGYSRDQIQNEINKWKVSFYPGGVESGGNTGGC